MCVRDANRLATNSQFPWVRPGHTGLDQETEEPWEGSKVGSGFQRIQRLGNLGEHFKGSKVGDLSGPGGWETLWKPRTSSPLASGLRNL